MMETRTEAEKESGETETRRFLRAAMPDFEVCVRRAVECIISVPTFMPKGFTLANRMPPSPSFNCQIHAGNPDYAATLSLGLSLEDFGGIVPCGECGNELAMDTVGELANVIAGSFLGRKSFWEPFGCMLPSPPVFSREGAAAEDSCCIHGALKANGVDIIVDFMIKPAGKDVGK